MEVMEKALEGLNLLEQKSFESDMNDPTIVIDKTHMPGFVRHRFSLWIYNTSDATLYFKIVEELPNWTLVTVPGVPADGKLGAIGAGGDKHFIGIIGRNLPAGESEDVGRFKVECYPDGTYTGLIESHSHPTTVYVEDLENWTNVQKFDFDDGTAQGWTLHDLIVSSSKSIEVGGHSLYGCVAASATKTPYLSKSINLPNVSKVRLSAYWFFKVHNVDVGSSTHILYYLKVYVNDVEIYTCFKSGVPIFSYSCPSGHCSYYLGWFKIGVDLSAFKGETVDIRVEAQTYLSAPYGAGTHIWIDDVVISGKN